ncbi:MAG: Asp-tRNA(Asn)/Glu-tRNA(Gln) amidotransferase subunit GatC [Chthoniobacterales bacterium]
MDIHHTAHLARIDLTPEEEAKFEGQLSQILKYVEQLDQLDVSSVEPTAHANAVDNVFRTDEPRESLSKEAALANAPHQANGLIMVTKVLD